MTISQNLLLAIFSTDAYNRGYNAGITIIGGQIGNATIGSNSSILLDANSQPLDQPASSFAQAYTIGDNSIAGDLTGLF